MSDDENDDEEESNGGLIPELKEIRGKCLKKKGVNKKLLCASGVLLDKHYTDIDEVKERIDDAMIGVADAVIKGVEPHFNNLVQLNEDYNNERKEDINDIKDDLTTIKQDMEKGFLDASRARKKIKNDASRERERIEKKVEDGFDQTNEKFDRINKRFDQTDEKIDEILDRLP